MWRIDAERALSAETAIVVNPDWIVQAIAEIESVTQVKGSPRRFLSGEILQGHRLVGTVLAARNESRQPVKYFPRTLMQP